MTRRWLVLVFMIASCGSGSAQAQGVLFDKSEIRFVAKQLGVNVEGKFRRFKANVTFRPKALATSKAELEIDLGSIDLASEESEKEVRGPLWFDTARFPVARFTSTSFRDLGSGRYEVGGRLALKGITREVVVPLAVTQDPSGNLVAQGSVPIKRLEFKVGEGAWADTDTVTDPVIVRFRITLPPQA